MHKMRPWEISVMYANLQGTSPFLLNLHFGYAVALVDLEDKQKLVWLLSMFPWWQ